MMGIKGDGASRIFDKRGMDQIRTKHRADIEQVRGKYGANPSGLFCFNYERICIKSALCFEGLQIPYWQRMTFISITYKEGGEKILLSWVIAMLNK